MLLNTQKPVPLAIYKTQHRITAPPEPVFKRSTDCPVLLPCDTPNFNSWTHTAVPSWLKISNLRHRQFCDNERTQTIPWHWMDTDNSVTLSGHRQFCDNGWTKTIQMTPRGHRQFRWHSEDTDNSDDTARTQTIQMTLRGQTIQMTLRRHRQFRWHSEDTDNSDDTARSQTIQMTQIILTTLGGSAHDSFRCRSQHAHLICRLNYSRLCNKRRSKAHW